MRMIKSTIHPDIGPRESIEEKSVFKRLATRAIVLSGEMILMLYTERYDDYSLPGGGLDSGEDIKDGMIRELQEETGAQNIREVKEFGIYEEFRPWYKPEFDIMHMISYCFTCFADEDLGQTQLEHYEVSNGMTPKWINIHDAITHNEKTMASSEKKGMSIERETYLLKLIREEFF